MHKSLEPSANFILIFIWAVVLVSALVLGWPEVVSVVVVTFVLGWFSGMLQAHALTQSANQFRTSETAKEVRSALASTPQGKYSIWLLWGTTVGLLVWVLYINSGNPFILWLAGYAAFSFAREIFALRGVFQLKDFP